MLGIRNCSCTTQTPSSPAKQSVLHVFLKDVSDMWYLPLATYVEPPPKKKQAVSSPGLRVQLHHVCFVPKSTPKSSILNRPTVVGYPVSLIYGNPQIVEDCSIMDIGWDDSRLKWCDGRWCELMTSFDTCIYHHMDVSIERMIYEYPNCRK